MSKNPPEQREQPPHQELVGKPARSLGLWLETGTGKELKVPISLSRSMWEKKDKEEVVVEEEEEEEERIEKKLYQEEEELWSKSFNKKEKV